ncbi:peptidoglycan-binding protein [Mucilaginibacter xinganensis]|uniref:Peptidoglycan binding domain-containing protein, putative n=1 Tax=Mucilaginibacter xinganensis TaxID=1234841 RepID=A0A223NX96_9SPHI|nr:peptidoglycan-binding protein [Mucilaginibacter xinganensis]ASU34181.1 peptidoglycan binding domain-containing protein, putative [Mucilaginibacter xinganensis]
MTYPGYTIQQHAVDITSVKAIQQQLNEKGCGPVKVNGDYDLDTCYAVMLFQTRFNDVNGNPLDADGIVGPITWAALFGVKNIKAIVTPPNRLLSAVLDIARSQIGVTEFPAGSNDGPSVYKYHDAAGIASGQRWSMAFVYWCFNQACTNLVMENPVFKTGDVTQGWLKAKGKILTNHDAKLNTSLILPGQVFIISTGPGLGHSGFVEKNENGMLTTIEGNVCANSSDGQVGVFRRTGRIIDTINTGFIQFE